MAPRRSRICALLLALIVLGGLVAVAPLASASDPLSGAQSCPPRGTRVGARSLGRAMARGCNAEGRIVEDHGAQAVVPPKGYGVYAEALTLEGTQEFNIETSATGVVRLSDLGDDTQERSFTTVLRQNERPEIKLFGAEVVANDTRLTPVDITDLPYKDLSTTDGAEREIDEPSCDDSAPYATRWYRFDAPDPRRIRIALSATHAVALAVFREDTPATLSPVACPPSGSGATRALISPKTGTRYLIRVGSVSETERGPFDLRVKHAVAHDGFMDARKAMPVPVVSASASDLPVRALETGEPQPGCRDIRSTLWYRFSSDRAKTLQATASHVNGSGAVLGVYRGTALSNLTRVGCATEGEPLRFRAERDRTYMFQVGLTKNAETKGWLKLRLVGGTPPPNDAFTDAARVGSLPYARNVAIGYGTTQQGEPQPGCSGRVSTAWFRFQPSHSGHYQATAASSQKRFVAVYRGERMGSLAKVACGRETVAFRGRRGTTYHLQLGRETFSLGDAKLEMRETIGPAETCVSCTPPCADGASDLLGYKQEGTFRWQFNTRTIPGGLDRSRALTAVKRGFANVARAHNDCDLPDDVSASVNFAGATGRRATACYNGPDGVNVVDFGPLEPGPIGMACAWWRIRDGVDELIESDVRFLPGSFWTLSPARKASDCRQEVDLEGVATHEAGHVFGLAHVEGEHRNLTMHWSPDLCTAAGRTFGLGDMKGLRSRY